MIARVPRAKYVSGEAATAGRNHSGSRSGKRTFPRGTAGERDRVARGDHAVLRVRERAEQRPEPTEERDGDGDEDRQRRERRRDDRLRVGHRQHESEDEQARRADDRDVDQRVRAATRHARAASSPASRTGHRRGDGRSEPTRDSGVNSTTTAR